MTELTITSELFDILVAIQSLCRAAYNLSWDIQIFYSWLA